MGFDLDPTRTETLASAIVRVALALKAVGIDEAGGDARRLIAAAIQGTSADLIRDPARELSSAECQRLSDFLARRCTREPISRILGVREFYGRPFIVTPAVLDPRPDTETLIDAALEIARAENWADRPIRILDIGTGSGAILLTLLAELPLAIGTGIDISLDALACAQTNAQSLGIGTRASLIVGDIAEGLPCSRDGDEQYDLIVSNPPYIVTSEVADLDPEVALFDPLVALDGGLDGLKYYRAITRILSVTPARRDQRQWTVFEVGAAQSAEVVEMVRKNVAALDEHSLSVRNDLGGVARCVAFCTHSKLGS
jgi:release factor glutamine methyltransferase